MQRVTKIQDQEITLYASGAFLHLMPLLRTVLTR